MGRAPSTSRLRGRPERTATPPRTPAGPHATPAAVLWWLWRRLQPAVPFIRPARLRAATAAAAPAAATVRPAGAPTRRGLRAAGRSTGCGGVRTGRAGTPAAAGRGLRPGYPAAVPAVPAAVESVLPKPAAAATAAPTAVEPVLPAAADVRRRWWIRAHAADSARAKVDTHRIMATSLGYSPRPRLPSSHVRFHGRWTRPLPFQPPFSTT